MENKKSLLRKINAVRSALNDTNLEAHFSEIYRSIDSFLDPKVDEQSQMPLPKEIKQGDLALFSDGACRGNPGPGAWAFVIQNSKGEVIQNDYGVVEETTNNKMELLAAIKAIEAISKEHILDVHLYTDSRYIVDGIQKWIKSWKSRGWKKADKKEPENLDLWKRIDELTIKHSVNFYWVKGHSGHAQNEMCDSLANKGLDEAGY